MKTILFVNACMRERGESRTLELFDSFIESYMQKHSDVKLIEEKLYKMNLKPLSKFDIERRDSFISKSDYSDKMFNLAHNFYQADKIIIAAPYWDLSFPSILKVYVENICVNGITFCYTENGPKGLCKFTDLMYITTSGGFIAENDFGKDYINGIAKFLGNGNFMDFSAQGLDIFDIDEKNVMHKACSDIARLADGF
ncbi:MAG TPA: NAD(P)H-dependent oxidoreductase [Acetivibrio sp.]|nr:NAD(P)H-dependent oxidoreductase [Acetivibrio sp.]